MNYLHVSKALCGIFWIPLGQIRSVLHSERLFQSLTEKKKIHFLLTVAQRRKFSDRYSEALACADPSPFMISQGADKIRLSLDTILKCGWQADNLPFYPHQEQTTLPLGVLPY